MAETAYSEKQNVKLNRDFELAISLLLTCKNSCPVYSHYG